MNDRSIRRGSLRTERSRKRRLTRLGALVAAGAAAGAANAATITVNTLADNTTSGDTQCTLREALANANADSDTTSGDCTAGSGTDTIQFQAGLTGTITLGGTRLDVSDSAVINGPGAAALTIDGNNASKIFYIFNGSQVLDVTISGLALTRGVGPGSAVSNRGENGTLTSVTVNGNTGDAVNLTTNSLTVSGSLTVQNCVISGTTTGRGIRVDHANAVSISGTTLSNNAATGKGAGGFFYHVGTTNIADTIVTGNSSNSRGGGLFFYNTDGVLTISNTQITGNTSGNRGGGIMLYKALNDVTIRNTVITGNQASTRGGGIFFYKQNAGTTLTIAQSTISGNSLTGVTPIGGGGIWFYKQSGTTVIENSTISGNAAPKGGAIYDYKINPGAALIVRDSTISDNTATVEGGNVRAVSFPTVTINNSIIANGTAPLNPDLETGASNTTVNYSLIENTAGATFTGANNITGVDPQLGPLANNGGPTPTHLPALSSPVVNAGDPAFVPPPTTDQRGFARVAGGRIDIGSVELNGGTLQLSSATYSVNENGGSVTITINRTGGTDPATVNYATSNGSAVAPADYTATSGTATFAAGATFTTFNVPIIDDATFEGNETFNVTISSPSADATLGSPTTAVVTIVENDPGNADVGVTKSAVGGGPFVTGAPLTFTINVTNAGPQAANNVVVTDAIPAGTTLVSATPSQGSCSGTTTVTCTLGLINNGGNATIALTITPSAAGPLSNTASVSDAPQPDPNGANNSSTANVTVIGAAAIPALGGWMKVLMAAMTVAVGLFMLKRE